MFEIEIMHLLNDYSNSDEFERKKIKASIVKLIEENNDDFNKFISTSQLDSDVKQFLSECYDASKKEKEEVSENTDFDLIKNKFEQWLTFFKNNNNIPDENCEKIIVDIINFYAPNRFQVIQSLFEINDSEDFEKFKNMLKNYLRKYYAEKIEMYYTSEAFENLGFFEKRKMRNKILDLLDDIGSYKFEISKIKEVISNV